MENYYTLAKTQPYEPMEEFIQQREKILQTKLEIHARQLTKRVEIRARHLDGILNQEAGIDGSILQAINERPYDFELQRALYKQLFDLGQERRREDTECWRDVAMVMRDFLNAWEADQQAKARWGLLRQHG